MANIYQTAMFNAERHPDRIAVQDGVIAWTFAQLCARARSLAGYLESLGVQRGDRVAAMLNNSADYLALLHATAFGAFSLVPVNTRYSAAELTYLVEDCMPTVIISDPTFGFVVDAVRRRFGNEGPKVWLSELPEFLPEVTAGPVLDRHGEVADDDVAMVMYTSGTTSTPKGAMLTHGNLVWNAVNYIVELGIDVNARALLATPLFHIGGYGVLNGPVQYAGGQLTLLPRFEPWAVLEALETIRPTHLFLLSPMWVGLTDLPAFAARTMPFVKYVQTAAAPLGEWRQQLIRRVFCDAEFGWGFGMTESCVTTIKNRYTREILEHPGSIGYLWRHVAFRLVDPGGTVLSDQRGPGELQIKGPTVFKGYWNNPGLTERAFTSDGWLRTGDIIRRDDDGFVYFEGRSKDMIKTGGENVAALEVENCLARHPSVQNAAAFGLPHEFWGEELVCAVVPIPGQSVDEEAIRMFCRTHLSGFKVPKRVFVVDTLPTSSSGKVQKFELRRRFGAAS